jgi:protein-S-isoprenylcysteine O-methyltransferase Ste14
MTDLLALLTIISWPLIPLFWIPLHFCSDFFKKIRLLSYLLPFVTWLPLAYVLYLYRDILIRYKIDMPELPVIAGIILLTLGTLLHIWTGKLLSLQGLIGIHEILSSSKGRVVRDGAFGVVRHPTYFAHTMMFSGVFLISGVVAVGAVTILDFIAVHAFVIPLEERELLARFGDDYAHYQREVPRFFPRIKNRSGL